MNIVYQIGDALYEEMPSSVAVHVVRARQATNDKAIDFATKLIREQFIPLADLKERVGMMRQWLNEDRIADPNRMVTNEDLMRWITASLEKPNK